jgi:hypothetical protein
LQFWWCLSDASMAMIGKIWISSNTGWQHCF